MEHNYRKISANLDKKYTILMFNFRGIGLWYLFASQSTTFNAMTSQNMQDFTFFTSFCTSIEYIGNGVKTAKYCLLCDVISIKVVNADANKYHTLVQKRLSNKMVYFLFRSAIF